MCDSEKPRSDGLDTTLNNVPTEMDVNLKNASSRDSLKHAPKLEAASPLPPTSSDATNASGPPPPPDGGLVAWLQVLGAFALWFNSWGLLNTYGVFQTYYESGALFTASPSSISWIGAIQSFMLLIVGFLAGPLYDRGYLRALICVGTLGIVLGHVFLSLSHTYWQTLLSQGFLAGIAAGCLFVPSVAVLPTYFRARIGLAIGIGSSGFALGGVIYPIVVYRLIIHIGFAWAVRTVALIALVTLSVPILVMRQRVVPARARSLIDLAAFCDESHYLLFVFATFSGLGALLFYLPYDAITRSITDKDLAFYLVSVFNAASVFGRIVPNAISDIIGPLNLIAPCAFLSGVLGLCLISVDTQAGILAITILLGFFTGVFIAMPPVCFVALIKDKSKIGTRVGMGFGVIAGGLLIGGPGAGAILGKEVEGLHWTGLCLQG